MKPGMQRDILVAFWFLFDEFDIGDDCEPPDPLVPDASSPAPASASPSRHSAPKKAEGSA